MDHDPEIKIKIILFLAIFLVITAVSAYPDSIYLKNNRVMDGIIKEETRDQVLLDVGFGTITVAKSEIEKIEKSGSREKDRMIRRWQDEYAQTGRWVPKGAENIFAKIGELRAQREDVVGSKMKKDRLQEEIEEKERVLADCYAKYEELNKEVARADKADVFSYNKIVAEVNSESARIGKVTGDLRSGAQNKKTLDLEFSNALNGYVGKISSFIKNFDREYERASAAGIKEEERGFYKWVRQEIDGFSGDFDHKEIGYSKDQAGMVVSASLNGKVRVRLVVDTGASLVIISKKTARELGIEMRKKDRKITLSLADNIKTDAIPVILDLVEVGGFRVRNVMAAITNEAPSSGVDGLLGMSFLDNFVVKIDSNHDNLILESFSPQG